MLSYAKLCYLCYAEGSKVKRNFERRNKGGSHAAAQIGHR
jgi:hypothetical protein